MDIVDKHNQVIYQIEQLRHDLYDMRTEVYHTVISMPPDELLGALSRIQDKELVYMIYNYLKEHPIPFEPRKEYATDGHHTEE